MKKHVTVLSWRDLWHPEMGGAEIYLTKMLEGLVKRGYDVTVLTSMYTGAVPEETRDGIRYLRKGGVYNVSGSVLLQRIVFPLHHLFLLAYLPYFYVRYLKKNTDLLIESYTGMPFWISLYEPRRLAIIYHIQSIEWTRNYGKVFGGFIFSVLKVIFPFLYRGTDIVTISESTKEEIEFLAFKPASLNIVSTGIDMPIADSTEKPRSEVNIVSLGRLKMTKNVDRAIRLIEYAVKNMHLKNITMKIAGKGEEEERLKHLVKKNGLTKHVEFLGYIRDEDKAALYRWGHLHLQLSEKEGWGITAIEAASQATPTMCFDVAGLRDSVKDKTGYIVRDADMLNEEWKRVLGEVMERSEGYVARQRACLAWARQFEWDQQMDMFGNIVDGLVRDFGS